MGARHNKTLDVKKIDENRLAAADELKKRLENGIPNKRTEDFDSTGQGRRHEQQIDNQKINSYLIAALVTVILIAVILSVF